MLSAVLCVEFIKFECLDMIYMYTSQIDIAEDILRRSERFVRIYVLS